MAKILVIDDSSLSRRILRSILESAGHRVIEVGEGAAALGQYLAEKPDLTLLDLTMEDMHGLEVLNKLREADDQAKVVIVTADIQSLTRKEAEKKGATAFLNKPLAADLVLSTIDSLLSGKKDIILNEKQRDALSELINISFSRAASSLSEITGHRVLLEVPKISVYQMDELSAVLGKIMGEDIATIHQIFTGPVSGDALLVLNQDGAITLSNLLTDQQIQGKKLDSSAREVLTEIGNILLNACLGTFGNLLQMRIRFSVPRLHVHELGEMLSSLVIEKEEMRFALVVAAQFKVRDSEVGGYLVIVLGISSLDLLIREIEKLG